ncbi:MAG: trypsin-like peptidase domain-containing protein [Caldilineaceae bacterium]|nr:trypsin-like peptidase domain-containing protein [Caldilineaceae bacterium]
MSTDFATISQSAAAVVALAGQGVVRVDARRRHPASGIVWSADGLILTAHHVVRRDDSISVGLADGRDLPATLVGRDPSTDLALLRVEATGLAAGEWRAEESLGVGELVLALGRPGQGVQASLGIISALGGAWRSLSGGKVSYYIRPDLVMYPGFSGGPLIDGAGKVIGLATSALTREGGIALSAATAQLVVETLLAHGRMRRGYLGIGVQPAKLPASVAEALERETGVLLNSIEADSPAASAGLLVGDILVGLDGEAVERPEDLTLLLQGSQVGQAVVAQIVRGGTLTELSVTVGER